ncbi:hypothetical protein [Noviherbaspirillum sp. Root189]|uniref:hypothetical protein n=1 Tax=Noviherbaspirillum sp. Root189 TaxID=1736487 RepID=UPI0012E3605F|nr:hypothetical protein [Noviherbaspirillum sp. Root189]
MKTNDERVAFPFDSELPGAVRFRIKPSRPGTRKLAAATLHPDRAADIDSRFDPPFPPQAPATLSGADGVNAASIGTGPASKILSNSFTRYLFIAVCICIAAAAFGASAGFYIVWYSPSSTSQGSSLPSRDNPVVQQEPSASEKMALKIAEMRRIASEESESPGSSVDDTKTSSSFTHPGIPMTHSNDGSTDAVTAPGTSPARRCSAASMALALCGEK